MYDPRYVWDPAVHRYFGEDLYFFILRAENPTRAYYEDVSERCKNSGVSAYCLYKLYGYYDGLLRVWANNDRLGELRALLQDYLPEQPIEFHVNAAFYDGWSEHPNNVDIRSLVQAERDVIRVSLEKDAPADIKDAVDRLRGLRFVHYMDPRESFLARDFPLIKFYCPLGPSRLLNDFPGGIDAIRQVIRQVDGIQLKSLYFGSADHIDVGCLIKGVISSRDLGQLDDWIDDLYGSLRAAGRDFRRMTLLVASAESPEADLVDCEASELGLVGQILRRILSDEMATSLYRLPSEERQILVNVFDEFRIQLIGTAFEPYFLGLIEARLVKNSVLLEQKLTFLITVEAEARDYLRNAVLVPQLGAGWYQVASKTAKELEARKKKGRAIETGDGGEPLLGLGEYVRVVECLEADGVLDTEPLRARLGPDWVDRLILVSELRNKWAHGSISAWLHKGGDWEGWPDVAQRACSAGTVYNTLVLEPLRDPGGP